MEEKKKKEKEEVIDNPLIKLCFSKKVSVTVGDNPSIKRIVQVNGAFISFINPAKDTANIEIFIPHWNANLKHIGQHTTLFLQPTGYMKAQHIKVKSKHNEVMEELLGHFLKAKEAFTNYSLEIYQGKCKVTLDGKPTVAKISLSNTELQVSAHSKTIISHPRDKTLKAIIQFEDCTKVDVIDDEVHHILMFSKPDSARLALISILSKPIVKEEIKQVTLNVTDVPYIGNAFLDVLNETSDVPIAGNSDQNQQLEFNEETLTQMVSQSGRLTTDIRQSRKYMRHHEDSDSFSTSVSMSQTTLNNPEAYRRALQKRKEKLEVKAQSRNKFMSNETLELLTDLNAQKSDNDKFPVINIDGLQEFDPLYKFNDEKITNVFTKESRFVHPSDLTYLNKIDVELEYNTLNNDAEIKAMNMPIPKPLTNMFGL